MRSRSLGMLGFALLLGTALALGEDRKKEDGKVEFVLKLSKGVTWQVEQTVSASQNWKAIGNGASHDEKLETQTISVKYADEGVEEDEGRPALVRRTYTEVKSKIEKDTKTAPAQGAVLLLKISKRSISATVEKGDPGKEMIGVLQSMPLDPVQLLLPSKRVKEGDSWMVAGKAVQLLHAWAQAGIPPRPKAKAPRKGASKTEEALGAMDLGSIATLIENTRNDMSAKLAVSANLVSLKDGAATIEYVGRSGSDDEKNPALAGMQIPGMPKTSIEVKATLTFHVDEGRPLDLDWKELSTLDASAVPLPGAGPSAGGSSKEEWNLKRTWKVK